MSEFTYACPVCHQHLKCTVSQAGTVMKCPTCYQRIVAPQAPSRFDTNLILTGQKYVDKKTTIIPPTVVNQPKAPEKTGAPIGIILTVIGVLAVLGAVFFAFQSGFFKRGADWQTSDIGTITLPGSFSQAQGVFTISGSGADIWYQADAFRYVFQPLDGDCTLTTRVLNLSNTHQWAKAGLLIRESLNPDAKFAILFMSPNSGLAFQQRKDTATPAEVVANNYSLRPPYWLRLIRQANEFTAYFSENGTTWTQMGSTTIDMGKSVYVGLAVCSHNTGTLCEAQFDNVMVKAGGAVAPAAIPAAKPLPPAVPPTPPPAAQPVAPAVDVVAGWMTSDIGEVGATGIFQQSQGVFTISGSGGDIWNQTDEFRYVYQPWSGDGTVTARVLQVGNSDFWAKCGLMMRESPNPDAKYAFVFMTPSAGIVFQQREQTAGSAAIGIVTPNLHAPYWLRLIRQGDVFTAYSSKNGTTWTKFGSVTVPMTKSAYVGLAVCSHKRGTLCGAQFDNVTVESGIKADK